MFSRKKQQPDQGSADQDLGSMIGVIEIFRAGTHRAMNGREITFTETDVAEIAAGFDPAKGPVPVVIGHPKSDNPAYAWLNRVYASGDLLYATLEDVDPAFAEIVRAGRYKRISAAFYPADAPNNPVPGQYYLRHVGFLGAAAPAVKGLKPVEFSAEDSEWLAFGERLSADAIAEKYQRQIRLIETERDLDRMVRDGKVLPRDKDGLLCFMATLDNTTMIAFTEDEDERTMSDWFKRFLENQPQQVVYGAYDLGDDPAKNTIAQFASPEGHDVDRTALNLHAKAKQIMREKGLRFEDALEFIHGD